MKFIARPKLRRFIRCVLSSFLIGSLFSVGVQAVETHEMLPQEVIINDVEFVYIPEGWFYKTGGVPEKGKALERLDESGGGNTKVWLDGFYIAKFEARARHLLPFLNTQRWTASEYDEANASCTVVKGSDGEYRLASPQKDLPATNLSWNLSNAWAQWMGFRLPSEAEWEKAARGQSQSLWPWGDHWPDETYAGFNTRRECYVWPVDAFAKGQSPYGVFNMAGNVREYVSDWYNYRNDAALEDGARNPTLPLEGTINEEWHGEADKGPWKMLKGGRWATGAKKIRVDARIYYRPQMPFLCNGARFALDVDTVQMHLRNGNAVISNR